MATGGATSQERAGHDTTEEISRLEAAPVRACARRARPRSNPAGQRERWLRDPPEQDVTLVLLLGERESENRYREVPPSSTVLDEQSVLAG